MGINLDPLSSHTPFNGKAAQISKGSVHIFDVEGWEAYRFVRAHPDMPRGFVRASPDRFDLRGDRKCAAPESTLALFFTEDVTEQQVLTEVRAAETYTLALMIDARSHIAIRGSWKLEETLEDGGSGGYKYVAYISFSAVFEDKDRKVRLP